MAGPAKIKQKPRWKIQRGEKKDESMVSGVTRAAEAEEAGERLSPVVAATAKPIIIAYALVPTPA